MFTPPFSFRHLRAAELARAALDILAGKGSLRERLLRIDLEFFCLRLSDNNQDIPQELHTEYRSMLQMLDGYEPLRAALSQGRIRDTIERMSARKRPTLAERIGDFAVHMIEQRAVFYTRPAAGSEPPDIGSLPFSVNDP